MYGFHVLLLLFGPVLAVAILTFNARFQDAIARTKLPTIDPAYDTHFPEIVKSFSKRFPTAAGNPVKAPTVPFPFDFPALSRVRISGPRAPTTSLSNCSKTFSKSAPEILCEIS
jgi:hypothetical protein